ncbi:MAG: hypothetical protein IGR93_16630 [Hydrococcus sp. C42_A2020_068]|nr:hypothetical protein [Hydrococcus sp. C42_A2020_068]
MENLEKQNLRSQFITFLPAKETSTASSAQYAVTIIAKIDKDVDVLAQMQDAFNNFIESGQVWALLIGFVLGYIFRSFTAY